MNVHREIEGLSKHNQNAKNLIFNSSKFDRVNLFDSMKNFSQEETNKLSDLIRIKASLVQLLLVWNGIQFDSFILEWNSQKRQNIMELYSTHVLPQYGYFSSTSTFKGKNDFPLLNMIQILHLISFRQKIHTQNQQHRLSKSDENLKDLEKLFILGFDKKLFFVGKSYYLTNFVYSKISLREKQLEQNFESIDLTDSSNLSFLIAASIQYYICVYHFLIWIHIVQAYHGNQQKVDSKFQVAMKLQSDSCFQNIMKFQSFWSVIQSTITSQESMSTFQMTLSQQEDQKTRQFLRSFKVMVAKYSMESQSDKIKDALLQITNKSEKFLVLRSQEAKTRLKQLKRRMKTSQIYMQNLHSSIKSNMNYVNQHHPARNAEIVLLRVKQVTKNSQNSYRQRQLNLFQAVFKLDQRKRYKRVSKKLINSISFDEMNETSLSIVQTIACLIYREDKINLLMRSILQNVDVQRRFLSTQAYQGVDSLQQKYLIKVFKQDNQNGIYFSNKDDIPFVESMKSILRKEPKKKFIFDNSAYQGKIEYNQAFRIGSRIFDTRLKNIIKKQMEGYVEKSMQSTAQFKDLFIEISNKSKIAFGQQFAAAIQKNMDEQYPQLQQNKTSVDHVKLIQERLNGTQGIQRMVFFQLLQETIFDNLVSITQARQLPDSQFSAAQKKNFQDQTRFQLIKVFQGILEMPSRPEDSNKIIFSLFTLYLNVFPPTQNSEKQIQEKLYKKIYPRSSAPEERFYQGGYISGQHKLLIEEIRKGFKLSQKINLDITTQVVSKQVTKISEENIEKVQDDEQKIDQQISQQNKDDKVSQQKRKKKGRTREQLRQIQKAKKQQSKKDSNPITESVKIQTQQSLTEKQKTNELFNVNGASAMMSNAASQSQLKEISQILQQLTPFTQKTSLQSVKQSFQKDDNQLLKNSLWSSQTSFQQHLKSQEYALVVELQYFLIHVFLSKIQKSQKVQLRKSMMKQYKNRVESLGNQIKQNIQKNKDYKSKIEVLVKKNQQFTEKIQKKRTYRRKHAQMVNHLILQNVLINNTIQATSINDGIISKAISFGISLVKQKPSAQRVLRTASIKVYQHKIDQYSRIMEQMDTVTYSMLSKQQSQTKKNQQNIVQELDAQKKKLQTSLAGYSFKVALQLQQNQQLMKQMASNQIASQSQALQKLLKEKQQIYQNDKKTAQQIKYIEEMITLKKKQLQKAKDMLQYQRMRSQHDIYHKIQRQIRVQRATQKINYLKNQIKNSLAEVNKNQTQLDQMTKNTQKIIQTLKYLTHHKTQIQTTTQEMNFFILNKSVIYQQILPYVKKARKQELIKNNFRFTSFAETVQKKAQEQYSKYLRKIAQMQKQSIMLESKIQQKLQIIESQQSSITLLVNQIHENVIEIVDLHQQIRQQMNQNEQAKIKFASVNVQLALIQRQSKNGSIQKQIKTLDSLLKQGIQQRKLIVQHIQSLFRLKEVFQGYQKVVAAQNTEQSKMVQLRKKIENSKQQAINSQKFLAQKSRPIVGEIKQKINSAFALISQRNQKQKQKLKVLVQKSFKKMYIKMKDIFREDSSITSQHIDAHAQKMTTQIISSFYQRQKLIKFTKQSRDTARSLESKLYGMKNQITETSQRQFLVTVMAQNFKKQFQKFRAQHIKTGKPMQKAQGDQFLQNLMEIIKMNNQEVSKYSNQAYYDKYQRYGRQQIF